MLVLNRKAGESLLIGDDVRITVVQISSHRVRLGIEAPSNINILRGELTNQPASMLPTSRRRAEPGRRTTKR
jgi:carbon storage regulator